MNHQLIWGALKNIHSDIQIGRKKMCVMKMKKLTTFVACAAMAGVFATSAFAANDAQVSRTQNYLNSKGIAYTVTASDVDKALAAG